MTKSTVCQGGVDTNLQNGGIFIRSLVPGGAAERDGRVHTGRTQRISIIETSPGLTTMSGVKLVTDSSPFVSVCQVNCYWNSNQRCQNTKYFTSHLSSCAQVGNIQYNEVRSLWCKSESVGRWQAAGGGRCQFSGFHLPAGCGVSEQDGRGETCSSNSWLSALFVLFHFIHEEKRIWWPIPYPSV